MSADKHICLYNLHPFGWIIQLPRWSSMQLGLRTTALSFSVASQGLGTPNSEVIHLFLGLGFFTCLAPGWNLCEHHPPQEYLFADS